MKLSILNLNSLVTLVCVLDYDGELLQAKVMAHSRAMHLAWWYAKQYGASSVVKG
jgi:hypothetical protein